MCATLKTDPLTAEIPVVMVTAWAEQDDRAVGLAVGADAYMTKPFSPVRLIELVREMLAGRAPKEDSQPGDLEDLPADQLVVYARDLRALFQQERHERQALEEAQHRLEELDQLKAAFLGVVTHELMTPFASIGLALEVLQRQAENGDPDLRNAIEDLSTQIAGLHRLVGSVVQFAELVSKRRDPQPGILTLDRLIPLAVQPVAVLAQAREIDFRVLIPSGLTPIRADPSLVSEAAFQMAHNPVKFNYPQGKAQVEVHASDEWLEILVTDTGIGMTKEQIATLGRPFEQNVDALRRGQEGLGIGWAFVRYVAQVHNGLTRVASKGKEKGSTFSLSLPVIR